MKNTMRILMVLMLALTSFGCQSAEVPGETKEKLLMEVIHYTQNGQESGRLSYTYDDNGNVISVTDGDITTLYEYEEDRLIKATYPDQISTYTYNENNELSEVIKTKEGEPYGSIKYEYDSSNNLIKMIIETDTNVFESIYVYNQDNQLVETYTIGNTQEFKSLYERDKDGNCIKETKYIGEAVDMVITSVYEGSLLISQKHDNKTYPSITDVKYEYNDDKQLIAEYISLDGEAFYKNREHIYE